MTTAQAILQKDGAEAAFLTVRREALEAQKLLAKILQEDTTRTWTVKELYDVAIKDRPDLSHTAMGIAFGALEKTGVVYLDTSLAVHAG